MTNNRTKNILIDKHFMQCPVCGKKVEKNTVCDVCNWENGGGLYEIDGGPNEMTLEEARKAYAEGRPVK